jgi:hypothetical protein
MNIKILEGAEVSISFQANCILINVNLRVNRIGEAAARGAEGAVCCVMVAIRCMQVNRTLASLNIGGNDIGDDGAAAIDDMLCHAAACVCVCVIMCAGELHHTALHAARSAQRRRHGGHWPGTGGALLVGWLAGFRLL